MSVRDRLAVLDRALIVGQKGGPSPEAPVAVVAPPTQVRREPVRPLHRLERALAALWWFIADGVLLGLAAVLRGLRPLRSMAIGAPVGCVAVGVGISLWWGSWAYAVIGGLGAICSVWFGQSEQSSGP